MSLKIVEFFGKQPGSDGWRENSASEHCPFLSRKCTKLLHGSEKSGVCTLAALQDPQPVICCPIRLYGEDYEVLRRVAALAFGEDIPLRSPGATIPVGSPSVRMFGKDIGGELRLPTVDGRGSYWVDWILAHVDENGELQEFVAVEVQTIDTTGNYRAQREQLLAGNAHPDRSGAGFNWENVSKRILPQLIYKGNVLQGERLCPKGLFFVCPTKVYDRTMARLGFGQDTRGYPFQHGAITFMHYGLSPTAEGLTLALAGTYTTTVARMATAFSAPGNLPDANVYEDALRTAIDSLLEPPA